MSLMIRAVALASMAFASWGTTAQAATLVHDYSFASGVTDVVGSANGTLMGNASTDHGQLVLDGNHSYVEFDQAIIPTTGSYSLAFSLTRTADQSGGYVEYLSQGNESAGLFFGSLPSNSQLRLGLTNNYNNSGITVVTNTGAYAPDLGVSTAYALVVNKETNTSSLFINGKIFETYDHTIGLDSTAGNTKLGAQYGSYGEYFAGKFDSFKVYQGALSTTEIAHIAAPVPEPESYVLALAGLLVAGVIGKNRRLGA
jgi:hypothetical protein